MLNFCSGDGIDNNESTSVHADDDEKDPLLSSSSSPSTDVFIFTETMMDMEETMTRKKLGRMHQYEFIPVGPSSHTMMMTMTTNPQRSSFCPLHENSQKIHHPMNPQNDKIAVALAIAFCRLKSSLCSHSQAGDLSCLILKVHELHRCCSRALARASLQNEFHLLLCKIATCITITLAMCGGSAMSPQTQQPTKTSNLLF